MGIFFVVTFFMIIILQTLVSKTTSQKMVQVLVPSPNSPISTSANVSSSQQCTKNSDESYAVCASYNNYAVKYNLQPFSFAAKGPKQSYTYSCDLYETASQSTSRAVCVKGNYGTNAVVYFHRVSDMINVTNVSIGITSNSPRAIVDTTNQVVYVSNSHSYPAIYKITNIGSPTPIVAGNLTSFGDGDYNPTATLIIGGFLFVHFYMTPARLARIDISSFTWNQTIVFQSGESGGVYDNLANDDNVIYDLTDDGILVRCTYKNNNFARFDNLKTGLSNTNSLAISPDSSFLMFTAYYSGIILVNTSTFSVGSRTLLPNPASDGYDRARGRPIILSKNTSHPICAFGYDFIFTFNISHVPFREKYPAIYPLPPSPINTSSGVIASLQCTKNSDESYAVCASFSDAAIKYNLQPFSFAAKGPDQGNYMKSCDLYETTSQSTSRAVCVKGYSGTNGIVYFHGVSDMTVITSVTIGPAGADSHVFIDTPSQIAFVSNCYYDPVSIYKITNIGSPTPSFAATLSTFGSGDSTPAAMLIIDGFLYVHFYLTPARLARIDITTFTWNQTINFEVDEIYGINDNLANDDNFIYDLTQDGILVRCTYKNNNFARFDSLNTGLSETFSLTMMPDKKALFVACQGNSLLQMVNASSFSASGNSVMVPSAFGRPIITASGDVYAFSGAFDFVYAFRYMDTMNTRSSTIALSSVSPPQTVTFSPHQLALTSSHSLMHSTPSLSLVETATPRANSEKTVRSLTHLNIKNKVAKTRTLSPQADRKNPFIQKISASVASALVASDATQAIAVVSIAVLGSISSSPVLGFNVGRQQAMTNFAKKSLEGDCRGLLPATTINEFEEHVSNPLGLGDSPTQMSIGGSEKLMSYYVGAVVGDFILAFGLVLLSQGIGMAVMKYFESKKNNNSNFGKMVRDRMGKKNNNKNSNMETTFDMMRRVFATSYVSLTLFFCLSFLLTPILSSSLIVLVAAMNDPKLKDHEVGVGLKILCVILAVIFCAVAVYFVVWSVFVRKQRKEKYRMLKNETEPSLPAKFFKAEGEWCFPNPTSTSQQNLSNLMKNTRNNKNESNNQIQFNFAYHNFLIAEPTFESYRDTIWFCCVEIISAILLAFPPFFAQFSSSAKGSCLVQGIMLLIIILIYTVLLIWKNPFKTRVNRIMNPVLAVQQLVIVVLCLIVLATRSSSDDDGESHSWLWKILIIPLAFQGAMSFLMIGAAFFPFVMFLKKLKGRMSRNQGQSEHKDRDLRGRHSSRSADRREISVEMLPKVKNEKSSSSKRDHRENNHRTDGDRRNNNHHNSRIIEHDNKPTAIPDNNNNNNNNNSRRNNENGDHHHHHRHENPGRNISGERETQRSSRNNNCTTEQRERERCARTLNISSSSFSPRRPLSNGPRPDRVENELLRRPNQFRDKTTQSNTSRR